MVPTELRHLAFLSLSISMVAVGGLGLVGAISTGPGLFAILLVVLVALSFNAGVTYAQIQSKTDGRG